MSVNVRNTVRKSVRTSVRKSVRNFFIYLTLI